MGRGLSLIQKRILLACLRKRFVLCQDLLTMWGVQPGAVVDRSKYGSAHASLSRTLSRLYWRGLVEYWQHKLTHYRTAITLTSEGEVLAQVISAEDQEEQFDG